MGSFRRRTQSEFRRFNINYLIGNGVSKNGQSSSVRYSHTPCYG